jgi:DNA-binding transcriptional regulator YiaG
MGKLEGVLKEEIIRLSKMEMKKKVVPLRRDVRSLKSIASQLRKAVLSLQRFVSQQEKEMGPKPVPAVTPEDLKTARMSPGLIKSLRKHLGISQRELAKLAGVTVGAVFQWEKGNFEPKDDKKKILIGLRKLGRQEAKRLLAEKGEEAAPKNAKVRREGKGKR